jgi:hypothetical protein
VVTLVRVDNNRLIRIRKTKTSGRRNPYAKTTTWRAQSSTTTRSRNQKHLELKNIKTLFSEALSWPARETGLALCFIRKIEFMKESGLTMLDTEKDLKGIQMLINMKETF